MAVRYNNQFQTNNVPSGLRANDSIRTGRRNQRLDRRRIPNPPSGPTSIDKIRRDRRNQVDYSIKLEQKIYGGSIPPTAAFFYTFASGKPSGGESLTMAFTFTGDVNILNFGDGTRDNTISSGETITKNY
jgi:hypothetical protein